jgi:hypothetical protein
MCALAARPSERSVVLFHYHTTRSGQVPQRLLTGYRGYLLTDSYEGYKKRPRQHNPAPSTCAAWGTRAGVSGAAQRAQPAEIKPWMRLAQKRTIEDKWRHVGKLVSTIASSECQNYFANAGYLPIKT